MAVSGIDLGKYKLGWHDTEQYVYEPKKGVNEDVVREISHQKSEPEWMTKFRLSSLKRFERKPMLEWFAKNMPDIDFDDIYYYLKPMSGGQVSDWDMLPEGMKETYEKLGIPEAERKFLAGVTAQYECLRGSTLVWTTEGMRPIKEIAAGDEVFSLDEATREIVRARVAGAACSGEKEVFEIRARGRVIGASANHPFLALRDRRRDGCERARYRAEWTPVEELTAGDYIAIPTDLPEFGAPWALLAPDERPESDSFPVLTSDDLMWWLGLFIGDGYFKHSGRYVTVELAIDVRDEALVNEIIRVTWDLFRTELRVSKDCSRLQGRGTAALADFLELNGIIGT